MRLIGCAVLALTFATSGWAAEHYVEVWNPPEAHKPDVRTPEPHARANHAPAIRAAARAAAAHTPDAHTAPPRRTASAKPAAKHKPPHRVAQAVRTRTHNPAAGTPAGHPVAPASGKLTVMQPSAPEAVDAAQYTDIPRQFTPEGNVLRVGTRNGSAKVTQ